MKQKELLSWPFKELTLRLHLLTCVEEEEEETTCLTSRQITDADSAYGTDTMEATWGLSGTYSYLLAQF